MTSLIFSSQPLIFFLAALLRINFLLYGLYQDSVSPLKYTDIDYYVFTDAARFVAYHRSPYYRDTYRYTPLLAWILLPTTWNGAGWFSFGKVVFATADLVAGYALVRVLKGCYGCSTEKALKYASIWLLNPMVITISTRGSSEGLLCAMVVGLLWAVLKMRIALAGVLLGLSVHFKIYPFIYGIAILWYLPGGKVNGRQTGWTVQRAQAEMVAFFTKDRVTLLLTSLGTFSSLNILMFSVYGTAFVQETYLHHVTRIDHRHNFSPYNTILYLASAAPDAGGIGFESLAFLPQLLLSCVVIPLTLAKRDLAGCMLAQTFAFVTFNKVCTSQVRTVLISIH